MGNQMEINIGFIKNEHVSSSEEEKQHNERAFSSVVIIPQHLGTHLFDQHARLPFTDI